MKRRNTCAALLATYAVSNMPALGFLWHLALVLRWPLLVVAGIIAVGQARAGRRGGVALWTAMFAAFAMTSLLWSTNRPTTAFLFLVGVAFVLATVGLFGGRSEAIGADGLIGNIAVLHFAVIGASLLFLAARPGVAIDSDNLRGVIGNSNGLGVLLALTAPAVWAAQPFRARHPTFYLGLCGLAPVMILASRSRSAVLALIAAMVITVLSSRPRTKVLLTYALAVVVVGVLAFGHGADVKRWLVDDLLYKDRTNGDLLSSRRTAFTLTLESARQHLVIGRGFGVVASPLELNDEGVSIPSISTNHREVGNSYLGILEQLGLVGFLLLMALVASVLAAVRRAVRSHDRNQVALAAIIVASLVAANFEAYLFATGAIEALITWSAVVVVVRSRTRVEVPV